nr:DUF1302 domain-containing protein [Ramlibacter sp. WS9]
MASTSSRHRPRPPAQCARLTRGALAVALVWGGLPLAHAGTVDLGDGVEAVWSLNASFTNGWRMANPEPALIGLGDGGAAAAYSQSTDLNFAKRDSFMTQASVLGDVNIRKGGYGLLLRAKAWDNYRLSHKTVPFGAPSNDFQPNTRLDDSNFDTRLSKFSGVALLDAYVYGTFDLTSNTQAAVRFGQHAVNFGESIFVPGVNQYSVLDLQALRTPGTQLKEAILPVPQVSFNLGLPGGNSVEAFYQFKWRRSVLEGCGTYWSMGNPLNCGAGAILVGADTTPAGPQPSGAYWNGVPALGGANANFSQRPDREPSDSGQFGLAFKKNVEALDTELGAYFVRYKNRFATLSGVRDLNAVPGSLFYSAAPLGSVFWDYDAKPTKVYGLSGSTVLGGWAVAGELSYTKDVPVGVNTTDAFFAMAVPAPDGTVGIGPLASKWNSSVAPLGSNTYLEGREYKNKAQFQVSTIKLFSNVLGASSVSLVGEFAFQHWSGIGDPFTSVRYGRNFEFGSAQHATLGGACLNPNPANCTQDGYFTSNAYGVRALVEAEYPNLIPGVLTKPRLFLSKDLRGWSADYVFSQGRHVIAPGVRFTYEKSYWLDLSYTRFNRKAAFDTLRDRDFAALALGMSF